jgi:hypothetical protein
MGSAGRESGRHFHAVRGFIGWVSYERRDEAVSVDYA